MSALGARKAPARDGLDRYYTPDPVAVACVDWLPDSWAECSRFEEPSVGGGAFVRAIRGRFGVVRVVGFDLDDAVGAGECDYAATGVDYLGTPAKMDSGRTIIGNPPYRDVEAHMRHALARAPRVAMLLRLAVTESAKRVAFWQEWPAAEVHVLAERPSFTANGKTDGAAYAFVVWDSAHEGGTILHPCRSWKVRR